MGLPQHFLLSAKARTLSLTEVARLSDDEAYSRFRAVRFAENDGEPFCPHCGSLGVYEFGCRKIFKCKGCEKQFSLTSGTIFADRKMSHRDILMAIAIFVNGAAGHAALRMTRDLGCSYKTAFVLEHKLREVFGTLRTPFKLTGTVEIDGLDVGGKTRALNVGTKTARRPRDEKKVQRIVTMRERRPGGRSLTFVFKHETDAHAAILAHVARSAAVRTDGASWWLKLGGTFPDFKYVNHTEKFYDKGIHINNLESFNSRVRVGERGVYRRIIGPHLQRYADEFAWREDHRRVSNGMQFSLLLRAAAVHAPSRSWSGYWRKRPPKEPAHSS